MLDIADLVAEYIVPKDCVKPDITAGNYYLKWNDSSYGIPRKEAPELKRFVVDIAPYLTAILFEAAGEIHRIAKEKRSAKESRFIAEAFMPQIQLARKRGEVTYVLQMDREGTTMINRVETVTREGKRTALTLQWNLGELLFDRQQSAAG